MAATHLDVHSAFSFLDGASLPTELIDVAIEQGIDTIALTDIGRLSGMVPFLQAADRRGIKGLVGAQVTVEDAGHLILLVPDTAAYPALTQLLTAAHRDSPRGQPQVSWEILEQFGPDLIALTGDRRGILLSHGISQPSGIKQIAKRLQEIFARDHLYFELTATYLPSDNMVFQALAELGQELNVPLVGTGAVRYARKSQMGLYDLMTCIRTGQLLESAGPGRVLNAENYLKTESEMTSAFRRWPEAWNNALELGKRLQTPKVLHRHYRPLFELPQGFQATSYLRHLVKQGAKQRYGARLDAVWPRIERELSVIHQLGFEDYFLVVWDVARYAREQRIRYAGRGSAADSVVAYCLQITDVDAHARNLLFERFMSPERQETPDIDIDFDARYRDSVENYVIQRYGRDHVARVATYQSYRQRLAVRDLGKVMGFPLQEIEILARSLPQLPISDILARWHDIPELRQYPQAERLQWMLSWAQSLEGLPRHLGTHLGGVVVSAEPLWQIGVRERSAKGIDVLGMDKRDVEAMGLLKLDLLSLRTFTAVNIASQAIGEIQDAFSYDQVPRHDEATYRRLQQGQGIGVFQLESPAQRALAVRLQPDRWEDIVASLALIRPGPIKGNMVEPFIARRQGRESVSYIHPDLEPILSKTYGVVLFQEQVIAIASTLAGFSPGEADQLRRVMTHARSTEEMATIGNTFREKAIARGVDSSIAEQVFEQIAGYASYGFNEAHAAAFAETAYRTAYLLEHHPREYFLGLLNAEPVGYYPIDVLLVEARRRGIEILPVDVNASSASMQLESPSAIRIGLQFVQGISVETAERIVQKRPVSGYRSPQHVADEVGLSLKELSVLVALGAFDRIDPDRGMWLEGLTDKNRLGLILPASKTWSPEDRVKADYRYLGFGAHEQWMARWRKQLGQSGFSSVQDIQKKDIGQYARIVGGIFRPHRPPTRSGKIVVFFSVLDESGVLEARLSTTGYQKYGQWLFGPSVQGEPRVLAMSGKVEAQGVAVTTIAPWKPPQI